MQSTYRLNASELDNQFLEELKIACQGKEVEIMVCEVDPSQHKLDSISKRKDSSPVETHSESLSQRRAFLKLSLAERRRLLSEQASAMVEHYQQNSDWQEWLAGDIVDYS